MQVDYNFIKTRSAHDLTQFKAVIEQIIEEVNAGDLRAYEHFLFESEQSGSLSSMHELLGLRYTNLEELKGQEWPFGDPFIEEDDEEEEEK